MSYPAILAYPRSHFEGHAEYTVLTESVKERLESGGYSTKHSMPLNDYLALGQANGWDMSRGYGDAAEVED